MKQSLSLILVFSWLGCFGMEDPTERITYFCVDKMKVGMGSQGIGQVSVERIDIDKSKLVLWEDDADPVAEAIIRLRGPFGIYPENNDPAISRKYYVAPDEDKSIIGYEKHKIWDGKMCVIRPSFIMNPDKYYKFTWPVAAWNIFCVADFITQSTDINGALAIHSGTEFTFKDPKEFTDDEKLGVANATELVEWTDYEKHIKEYRAYLLGFAAAFKGLEFAARKRDANDSVREAFEALKCIKERKDFPVTVRELYDGAPRFKHNSYPVRWLIAYAYNNPSILDEAEPSEDIVEGFMKAIERRDAHKVLTGVPNLSGTGS